jgi:hypothetical protein
MDSAEIIAEESRRYQEIRSQAKRYLESVYGNDVWYRAPETFANLVERWIWNIASGITDYGDKVMTEIETHVRAMKEEQK